MHILKYLQLPYYFDAKRLQEEVDLLARNSWQQHYQKLHYEGGWSAIPLRSVGGKSDDIIVSPLVNAEYADTVFLKECPYLEEVLSVFDCPLLAARLLKLDAGAVIKEHQDAELCYEKGEIRIHIPVVTHDEVEFFLDGERILLKEGECWYMNFNLVHNVNNKSSINRIHLVIDAKVNNWVKQLFENPGIVTRKTIKKTDQYDEATKRQMILRLREMNTATAIKMAEELEKEMGGPN